MEIRVLEIIAVREREPEFRGSLCLLVDTRESGIRRCGFIKSGTHRSNKLIHIRPDQM